MLLAIILPSAFADRGPHSVRRAAYRSGATQANDTSGRAAVEGMLPAQPTVCHPSAAATGYSKPLANATVRGERVDQGVDYAGTGSLVAIGAGRVTYVGTSGTGWPGAYLQYQLLDGPNAGCYVFYAEGVTPVSGLRVGDTISRGQTLATIIPGWPTGIELGWGAGDSTRTYTAKTEGWTAKEDHADHASAAGKSFSELIRALGGPAGKIEG
jgi:murein DD-endopeptidase MepM/ murein hydrolase activator NlpD